MKYYNRFISGCLRSVVWSVLCKMCKLRGELCFCSWSHNYLYWLLKIRLHTQVSLLGMNRSQQLNYVLFSKGMCRIYLNSIVSLFALGTSLVLQWSLKHILVWMPEKLPYACIWPLPADTLCYSCTSHLFRRWSVLLPNVKEYYIYSYY